MTMPNADEERIRRVVRPALWAIVLAQAVVGIVEGAYALVGLGIANGASGLLQDTEEAARKRPPHVMWWAAVADHRVRGGAGCSGRSGRSSAGWRGVGCPVGGPCWRSPPVQRCPSHGVVRGGEPLRTVAWPSRGAGPATRRRSASCNARDYPGVAVDRHAVTVLEQRRGSLGPEHCGNAILAGHNRCV